VAEGLLQDQIVQRAVSRGAVRAERQDDIDQLVATFVDPGISVQLENDNNQILYSRRGTGKTHVLKVVERRATDLDDTLALYRSTCARSGATPCSRTTAVRCTSEPTRLLTDILAAVENGLLEYVTDPENEVLARPREARRPDDGDHTDGIDGRHDHRRGGRGDRRHRLQRPYHERLERRNISPQQRAGRLADR
jgi:hypothetical protein